MIPRHSTWLAGLCLLACTACSDEPPTPMGVEPTLPRAAIGLVVDVAAGRVTVVPTQAPTSARTLHSVAPSFALLGQNEIGVTTSNFFRSAVGAFTPLRVRVRFDLALTNKLPNGDLVPSTFPAPPPGVAQVVAFPFATNPAGLFGLKVKASTDWNGTEATGSGAPHNFFNDDICVALTPPSDCFRWEAFGSTVAAGATTPARTVGFDVDPSVNSFTVYVVLAADIRETSARPAIAVSEASAIFSALVRGGSPNAQVVHVTNAGGGALTGLETHITYENGQPQGWLSASLSATTAPADLTLQPTSSTLDPGIYRATIALASADAANSPLSISVGLLVGQPLIKLSPTHVEVTLGVGGVPKSQLIQVTSASGAPISNLTPEIACSNGDCSWVTATLSSTTTPATLTLTETPAGLPPGGAIAQVRVSSPLGTSEPAFVQVLLDFLPDLAFTGSPIVAARVGTVTVTDLTVTNLGSTAAGPYSAGVCLSATPSIAGCLPGVEAGFERPSLAGAGVDHLPPLQVLAAPGRYHVIAYVDPPNVARVLESDESNNVRDLGEVAVPAPEVCDGIDNDLDGAIDEGFSTPCTGQPTPVLYLFPDPLMIKVGQFSSVIVTISPVQSIATEVALAINPATAATIPSSVTIPPFTSFATFDITGLSPGAAVLTATVNAFTAASVVTVTE